MMTRKKTSMNVKRIVHTGQSRTNSTKSKTTYCLDSAMMIRLGTIVKTKTTKMTTFVTATNETSLVVH
jgi:hypothetical protein